MDEAIRKIETDRLMDSQRRGQNYQKMVQNRLAAQKNKSIRDYDAGVKLLAALQPNGVSMHNIEHTLKRNPMYENANAYKIKSIAMTHK